MRTHRRLRFFSAPPDDVLFPAAGPAVWAFIHSTRIVGFDDSLRKVVDLPYTPANGGNLFFTEGSDGKLYGIILDSSEKQRQVVKITLGRRSISVQNLTTFPSGVFPDGRVVPTIEGAVVVGPDGRIYFTEQYDPLPSGESSETSPFGIGYKRLSGESLLAAGSIESAWTDGYTEIHLFANQTKFQAHNHTPTVFRHFRHAILKTGRWVVADPLRRKTAGNTLDHFEWTNPGDLNEHSVNNINDPITMTVRMWGNVWWDREDDAAAWAAVANAGIVTAGTSFWMGSVPFGVSVHEIGNPPSKHKNVRVSQRGATDYLPTLVFNQTFWVEPTTGEDVLNTDVPFQRASMMVADASFLYLMVRGEFDAIGIYRPGGIYRAPVPDAGTAPAWTKIISEPDFSNWQGLAVSEKWIWVSSGASEEGDLRAYSKSNTDISKIVFSGTQVPRSLTTAWDFRWK